MARPVDLAVEHLLHLGECGLDRPTPAMQISHYRAHRHAPSGTLVSSVGLSVSPSRVGLSRPRSLVAGTRPPPSLVALSVSRRPGRFPPVPDPSSFPLGCTSASRRAGGRGRASRRAIPNKKPVVQKLRSSIQRSLGWTVASACPNSERSCAWPSSQGKASMTSINWGSSTTKVCPAERRPHGPQLFDAMLGPGQMVAVEDLDAIAWQQRRGAAVHGGDDRRQTLGRQRTRAAPTAGSMRSIFP